jgi:hypothetical protein
MGTQVFDERTVLNQSRLVVPADGTGVLALVTATTTDRRIDTLLCANRDGIAHVVSLVFTNGAVVTQLGSVSVPAGTGYAGTPAIDLLVACFPVSQAGLAIQPTQLLGIQLAVAVVATFDLSVTALGGQY